MAPLVALLIFGGIVLVIWLVTSHQKKVDAAWNKAAELLGMQYQPGGVFGKRSISGWMAGHRVAVDTYTKSSGKSSNTYTRYRVHYPEPLGLGLQLKKEGFLSSMAKLFGSQDIEVGDPQFDDEVLVKGTDPRRVVEFLTHSRRMRILRLLNSLDGCEIGDASISYSRSGTETDPERMQRHVRRMISVAARLSDRAEESSSLDRAIEAKRAGELGQALEHVRRGSAAEAAPDADSSMVEGEILYTGGRYDEAAQVFEQARQESPEDDELEAWAEHSRKRAATAEPPPVESPVPLPPAEPATAGSPVETTAPPSPDGPSAQQVCEQLFDPKVLSLDASKLFEERYLNRRVRWTGTLRQARDYAFDIVFGDEPGTKLVVDVHEVQGGAFGRTVQALVRLPREALQAMQDRIGQPIAFEGRLISCDAFMRNLYVDQARVL